MKLKKVLCMAVISAAVALAGVPVSGTALTVHAEETRISALDEILRQMYALYVNGDYALMSALDADDATQACVESVRNSGSDRYVMDLDGSMKAMMYLSDGGGWWWYFGQMENNLRQGNGTTIICGSDYTESFNGMYNADFPGGEGIYTINLFYDEGVYNISGNFQGIMLNGTYQVDARWFDSDGIPYSSSWPVVYTNNHFQSVVGLITSVNSYPEDGYTEYEFLHDYGAMYAYVDEGYELFAVGIALFEDHYSIGRVDCSTQALDQGIEIFEGNASAAAYAPSEEPAPEAAEPAPDIPETPADPTPEAVTPVVPEQPAVPGTYTTERGDNLSKIAKKLYGDEKYWKAIYEANKDVIKSDYMIWVNQVLVIPQV